MRTIVAFVLILISIPAIAQLREFEAAPMQDPGNHIVQASVDFPDYAIVLVYSTFDNLSFRSSMSAIGKMTYNEGSARYEILIQPVKQVIFVGAPGFIEIALGTVSPNPKQAIYFTVDEKLKDVLAGRGTIDIQSDPPDAMILINDIETVYRTPSVREIPAEPYQISLRKDTYLNFDSVVRVKAGQRTTLRVRMIPAWTEVSIAARPADAMITIGALTAIGSMDLRGAAQGLTPGIYTLRVERPSYRTFTQTLQLKAGDRFSLNPVLAEIRGRLSVRTEPAGASVRIGNRLIGETPLQTELLIGSYELRIERQDYGTIELPVTIRENQTETINQTLTRGRQITINSVPPGADLHVDGQVVGSTPASLTLSFGSHKIEVVNGSVHESETIHVRDEGQTQYSYDVRKTVKFTVSSTPSEAQVYLDGEFKGFTPLDIRAKVGDAKLKLTKGPKWATLERDITITESEDYNLVLATSEAWDQKRKEFLDRIYDDGMLFDVFTGPLQYMSRGDRQYVVLPSFLKLTWFSDAFTNGDHRASLFFALGVGGETQVNKQLLYYEWFSASLGLAFANPTHKFRFIIEGRVGYSYEWNYRPDQLRLNGRAVSAWIINSSGQIDRSRGAVKNILTPGMLRISIDRHLFGKVFLEGSAGVMIRGETAKWFYTDDVSASSFSNDPKPITSSKLPSWPVVEMDPFWAVGIRF